MFTKQPIILIVTDILKLLSGIYFGGLQLLKQITLLSIKYSNPFQSAKVYGTVFVIAEFKLMVEMFDELLL